MKKLPVRACACLAVFIACFLIQILTANAQKGGGSPASTPKPQSSQDSTKISASDSSSVADSVSLKRPKGDMESVVEYGAEDSMRFDAVKQVMYLYGKAKVTFGDIGLEAADIEVDWTTNTLKALGRLDSAGKQIDPPSFKDKTETFTAKEILYNYITEKGLIKEVSTKQGEGIVHGETVKKDDKDQLFIRGAQYTTCDAEHPHFGIKAKKIKLVPNKYVITGPFYMHFSDVPVPLGFAFGFFPMPRKRNSGVIIPTYGFSVEHGYFLRDGGYYWAVNDYIGAKFTGQVFANGSTGAAVGLDYTKRYAFNGSFNLEAIQRINEDPSSLERTPDNNYSLKWAHSPQTKGTGKFSSNVDIATNGFNKKYSRDINTAINPKLNSNLRYSKTFKIKDAAFSFGSSLGHNQDVNSGIVTLSPTVNLAMNQISPFQKMKSNKIPILKNFGFAYNFETRTAISNFLKAPNFASYNLQNKSDFISDTVKFNAANIKNMLDNVNIGFRHSPSISTSFSLLKYFNVSPNFNYAESWYLSNWEYKWPDSSSAPTDSLLTVIKKQGFSRVYNYSGGVSMSTTLYGNYYFKKWFPIKQIRNTIVPNIGLNFSPDFSDPKYGYFQDTQTDSTRAIRRLSKYDGYDYFSVSTGRQGALTFGLGGTLDMKLRGRSQGDSLAKDKKIQLIRQFNFGGQYNFVAESFKLSLSGIGISTRLFNLFDIRGGFSVDPYVYRKTGEGRAERINQYRWQKDTAPWVSIKNPNPITDADLSTGITLTPDTFRKKTDKKASPKSDWQAGDYVPFKMPWTLSLSYTLRYSNGPGPFVEPKITQTLGFSGNVDITEAWKMTFSSGYDFVRKNLSATNFNISRDLHCWTMSLNWVPFGNYQSYNFSIRAKSSMLQDLKYEKRNTFYDR